MPSTSATRRASPASSMVQHPRALSRSVAAFWLSARCTPTTSCPASTIRAAATAESTPPLIAATTLIDRSPAPAGRAAGAFDGGWQGGQHRLHVLRRRGVAEGQPQGTARLLLRDAHGQQHVAGLRDARLARRTGRALDPGGVEQVQQRVSVAARDEQVDVARKSVGDDARSPGTADRDVETEAQRSLDEGVTQTRQPGRLLGQLADRLLDGDGEPADRRDVEGPAADLALLAAAVGQGHQLVLPLDDERADADRAAQLVRRERGEVDARR